MKGVERARARFANGESSTRAGGRLCGERRARGAGRQSLLGRRCRRRERHDDQAVFAVGRASRVIVGQRRLAGIHRRPSSAPGVVAQRRPAAPSGHGGWTIECTIGGVEPALRWPAAPPRSRTRSPRCADQPLSSVPVGQQLAGDVGSARRRCASRSRSVEPDSSISHTFVIGGQLGRVSFAGARVVVVDGCGAGVSSVGVLAALSRRCDEPRPLAAWATALRARRAGLAGAIASAPDSGGDSRVWSPLRRRSAATVAARRRRRPEQRGDEPSGARGRSPRRAAQAPPRASIAHGRASRSARRRWRSGKRAGRLESISLVEANARVASSHKVA